MKQFCGQLKYVLGIFGSFTLVAGFSVFIGSCGSSSNEQNVGSPGTASTPALYSPTQEPIGNYDVSCGKQPMQQQQQQKQATYQPKQSTQDSCAPQFEFVESKITDFVVNLDCEDQLVYVQHKGNDQKQISMPIQSGGYVRGQMSIQQQVQNDGKGNMFCVLKDVVVFEGLATCQGGAQNHLDLNTQIQFASANSPDSSLANYLSEADSTPLPSSTTEPFPNETPSPIINESPTPFPSLVPIPSPSLVPLPSPSIVVLSPSPSPSTSPSSCDFTLGALNSDNPVTVTIPDNAKEKGCSAFGNEALQIQAGAQVTWINQDSVPHTVTSDQGDWDSGIILPGQTFSKRFEVAGQYSYHCSIHPEMKGLVVARPATLPSPSPFPSLSPSVSPTPVFTILPFPPFSPSPNPSHSASPSPFPTYSPSPSPRPTVTPSQIPTPRVTVTQSEFCMIERPCPVTTTINYSCSAQQSRVH